jgi:hypothetical protein
MRGHRCCNLEQEEEQRIPARELVQVETAQAGQCLQNIIGVIQEIQFLSRSEDHESDFQAAKPRAYFSAPQSGSFVQRLFRIGSSEFANSKCCDAVKPSCLHVEYYH